MGQRASLIVAGAGIAGFGLTLAVEIFSWKGLALPDWLFIFLLAVSVLAVVSGLGVASWPKGKSGSQTVEIVKALSKFMEEAQALHEWAKNRGRPEGGLIRSANRWHDRVHAYLETQLGRDCRVRLHIHHDMQRYGGPYPKFSKERNKLCEDLDYDIRRLNEFLVEVRRR